MGLVTCSAGVAAPQPDGLSGSWQVGEGGPASRRTGWLLVMEATRTSLARRHQCGSHFLRASLSPLPFFPFPPPPLFAARLRSGRLLLPLLQHTQVSLTRRDCSAANLPLHQSQEMMMMMTHLSFTAPTHICCRQNHLFLLKQRKGESAGAVWMYVAAVSLLR